MDAQREFGVFLRSERKLRQIPLAEIAAATKIPLQSLERLESGAWNDLPPQVFVRGFVRSYAKHLGLPEEDTARRYDAALERLKRIEDERSEPVGEAAAEVSGHRGRFGLALFVIILLIIASITLSVIWRRGVPSDTQAAVPSRSDDRPESGRRVG
ncbi:MAG: helix-turn-helix domain-containing protein [Deltaproteobacteria bacterium]|nr:helix-turn-helix domain-containing protein [Deltaproteobacteria bacterium]